MKPILRGRMIGSTFQSERDECGHERVCKQQTLYQRRLGNMRTIIAETIPQEYGVTFEGVGCAVSRMGNR